MNPLDRLIAIEEIKALMARRVRCLDNKDWDGFADCYAPDASASWSETGNSQSGGRAIAERNANSLRGITTVHQVHTPEITIETADSASAIWPLNDILSWERGGKRHWYRGYGHYHQRYVRKEGRWFISEHKLTRLFTERGSEDPGTDHGPIGPGQEPGA